MRILLVDPSRTALKIVTRLLEGGDHQVCAFTDEVEALDYLGRDPDVDALLTSVELGQMSGLELCWQARIVAGDRRPLYIIVMSSNYERGHLIEALDSGADDFIGKPPVAEELYARLRAASRVVGMQRDLIRLASTDPLTGAFNRRAFFRIAGEACERAAAGTPMSAIMMDIDHFKKINDVHGHDVGDLVLRGVADEAGRIDGVVFGRLGGEEFGMVLEGRNAAQAHVVADGLRVLMTQLSFPSSKGAVTLTCSFGVTEYRPGDAIDTMLKRADVALYEAKTGGRNRVIRADDDVNRLERPGGIIRAARRPGEIDLAAE
jgi:two-component system cell cycle response regulator